MRVLLSIKPEFAEKIFSGEKKFEFLRAIFKKQNVKKVVVYASAPISMAIGEFDIEDILSDDIMNLWDQTKEFAGITQEYFLSYFSGRDNGYAIKVRKTKRNDRTEYED